LRELELRLEFDSAPEILRSATVINAELLMQKGKLGTIAAGAYADLLVVDGNPLVDLGILLDAQHKLKLVMKAGVIYKNALSEHARPLWAECAFAVGPDPPLPRRRAALPVGQERRRSLHDASPGAFDCPSSRWAMPIVRLTQVARLPKAMMIAA